MRTVEEYLQLVPAFNADKPKFMATLALRLQPYVEAMNLLRSMSDLYDLDLAIGNQLDAVGVRIGRNRLVNVALSGYFSFDIDGLGFDEGYWQGAFDPDTGVSELDDDSYRLLLRARALANSWDGTSPGAQLIYNQLLGPRGFYVQVIDNQDMSMTVNIFGATPDDRTRALITGGYLGLKPGGVSVIYQFRDFESNATFTRASPAYFLSDSALVRVENNEPRRM